MVQCCTGFPLSNESGIHQPDLSSEELEANTVKVKKHHAMMAGFDKFSIRMAKRYTEVRDCLDAERFEEAYSLLADIGISHARTSLSLRNMLVKDGKLMEDK